MTSPVAMRTRVRLTATSPGRRLLLAVGNAGGLWFGWFSVAGIVAPGRPGWERVLAVLFTAIFLYALLALPLTVRSRLRWLDVDLHGLRLVRGSGAVAAEVPWSELAGVGMLADPAAARRAVGGKGALFRLILYRVPPWLELVPAPHRPAVVRPGLGPLVPAADDQPARWMVRLNEGWARRPDVGEAVRRWRPELWRGERDGSVPTSVEVRASVATPSPWLERRMTDLRRRATTMPVATGGRRAGMPDVRPPGVPPPGENPPARSSVADAAPVPSPVPSRPVRRPGGYGPPTVLDLPRGPRARAALLRAVPAALVAAVAVLRPDVVADPARVALLVAGPLALIVLLLAVVELVMLRHPVRLVADDRRLTFTHGGRPAWSLPWSDTAGVRVERRGRRTVLAVRPAGAAAVDAHPGLARRRRGGVEEWWLVLGPGVTGVRELVVARRPELWTPL